MSSSKCNGGYQAASRGTKSKPFKNVPLTNGHIMLPRKKPAICSLQLRSSRERLKEAASMSNVNRLPPTNYTAVHRPSSHHIRDDQLVAATTCLYMRTHNPYHKLTFSVTIM
uniref:Uncharacterized protein n=1 Tax=Glossina austeni TaxID=7395 RepID=A0A1A9V7S9_GLOAU